MSLWIKSSAKSITVNVNIGIRTVTHAMGYLSSCILGCSVEWLLQCRGKCVWPWAPFNWKRLLGYSSLIFMLRLIRTHGPWPIPLH